MQCLIKSFPHFSTISCLSQFALQAISAIEMYVVNVSSQFVSYIITLFAAFLDEQTF